MIYGFSPHYPEITALLKERNLSCLRRGCDCNRRVK